MEQRTFDRATAFVQAMGAAIANALFTKALGFRPGRYDQGRKGPGVNARRRELSVVGDKHARNYRKRYSHILSGIVTARQLDAIQRRAA